MMLTGIGNFSHKIPDMFYKHLFTLRRHGVNPSIHVNMMVSCKWPGGLDKEIVSEEELEGNLLSESLRGEDHSGTVTEADRKQAVKWMKEAEVPRFCKIVELRRSLDRPVGGHILCVNAQSELSVEDIEAYLHSLDEEELESFINDAKIKIHGQFRVDV